MINTIKKLFNKDLPAPEWLDIARREVGITESIRGETARIIEYHAATTLHSTEDEVPWCSAYVNWVMMKSGFLRTHSAAARSWLGYGRKIKDCKQGAIVIFRRGSNPWQGHVAFVVEDLGERVRVLGGNQNNSVCYASYPKSRIIGLVYPTEAERVKV